MIRLEVSIQEQTLRVFSDDHELKKFTISSAKNGVGTEEGSLRTPLGNFVIAEKHGHDAPIHTIFSGRKAVGVWDPCDCCEDDLITTRILWLDGTDPHNANTKQRYIYIHGTSHEDKLGSPHSCGCIRMHNADIIELFDQTPEGTCVTIR